VRAVQNGTRTRTGAPGEKYWFQHTAYLLRAELSPETRTLSGTELAKDMRDGAADAKQGSANPAAAESELTVNDP
jgi:hypothetical protein